ncbi:matrixin family metalloprotease [Halorussus halophilus]|uniref:matrixin family metalloprotease n=1 Tax=Halorussus halophilus TaxID=2650975 RepID=UPI001788137A|nr:matrixin family metalloprotease [Halorussus halophilus]
MTVGIDQNANLSRDIRPLVNETLRYWNENATRYGDYDVQFVSTPSSDADLVVNFTANVTKCGIERDNRTLGCAPILEPNSKVDQETVEIEAGYTNKTTLKILKHEFGHVMGLEHGAEPMPLMAAVDNETERWPDRNLADRAWPRQSSNLSVYYSLENVSEPDREEYREQIQHALDYYANGADGYVPANVSFTRTTNQSGADVVVEFPESTECGGERVEEGSCASQWVINTDQDEAAEYLGTTEIAIMGMDADAVGWHVGVWLADSFGLEERPPPFVDADYDERRDEWWN